MSRTVARPTVGLGCDRRITTLALPLLRPTLDPGRSTTLTPQALSSDSISSHRMSAGVDLSRSIRGNAGMCQPT